jgi:hypothetical protein
MLCELAAVAFPFSICCPVTRIHLMPLKRKQCISTVVVQPEIIDFHFRESPRLQNNAFNKAIVRHNQLRLDLRFSPWDRTLNFSYVVTPTTDATVMSHEITKASSSSPQRLEPPLLVLRDSASMSTKTRTTAATAQRLGFHVILRLWIHHGL